MSNTVRCYTTAHTRTMDDGGSCARNTCHGDDVSHDDAYDSDDQDGAYNDAYCNGGHSGVHHGACYICARHVCRHNVCHHVCVRVWRQRDQACAYACIRADHYPCYNAAPSYLHDRQPTPGPRSPSPLRLTKVLLHVLNVSLCSPPSAIDDVCFYQKHVFPGFICRLLLPS